LRERLAGYKMPTLLRIASGELPKTATGKVQKKILGPKFFPLDYEACPEVQQWVMPSMHLAKL
jgi:malonyl-CoA/methylmalonyl-CoA synthetase